MLGVVSRVFQIFLIGGYCVFIVATMLTSSSFWSRVLLSCLRSTANLHLQLLESLERAVDGYCLIRAASESPTECCCAVCVLFFWITDRVMLCCMRLILLNHRRSAAVLYAYYSSGSPTEWCCAVCILFFWITDGVMLCCVLCAVYTVHTNLKH